MRGEHAPLPLGDGGVAGIIPACAGSTAEARRLAEQALGSSPHARGAPPMCGVAGRFFRDHPRMRGEHRQACAEAGRVRGIIPACAGSTQTQPSILQVYRGSSPHARGALHLADPVPAVPRDHPRMRGEHVPMGLRHRLLTGIIPACAGSTQGAPTAPGSHTGSSPHARGARHSRTSCRSRPRDHPRMRGEHEVDSLMGFWLTGIIPACAGSTGLAYERDVTIAGSSPHARGAPNSPA